MVMIALCSSLIGAVLGIRFRVQVLFPAAMFGLLTVAAVAAFKGYGHVIGDPGGDRHA